ncbi:MAG TPA: hypothetical protein VGZ25_02675 [Gemmataceae bacterium]|jgi:hypothetical protein|nr:hypothetical protein [Gemmataceae bacterium]
MKNFFAGLLVGLLSGLLIAGLIFYDLTKKNRDLRTNLEMEQGSET